MKGSTIFIAGVYGTGKSIMCSALSEKLHIPAFSSGDLISAINGEQYGVNKAVINKENNQVLLAERVRKLNYENEQIILAGHFCIFNADNGIEVLSESVYLALNIERIVLLEADVQTIIANLSHRDGKYYSAKNVSMLAEKEREQCERISKMLKYHLDIHTMTFTDSDLKCVASLLCGGSKS